MITHITITRELRDKALLDKASVAELELQIDEALK